ncbi:MAG: hypothetical protein Q9186_002699 [Xanthomendoza sp. 1 TL-2023]
MTDGDALDPMEQTELEILVPYATSFKLEDLKAHVDPNPGEQDDAKQIQSLSTLASIPSRTILHFDELLNVFIVLRTPSGLEKIQRRLPQLKITLEVQAFGSENRASHAQVSDGRLAKANNRDVIWSGSVDTSQQPLVVGDGSQGVIAALDGHSADNSIEATETIPSSPCDKRTG